MVMICNMKRNPRQEEAAPAPALPMESTEARVQELMSQIKERLSATSDLFRAGVAQAVS